jgi:hypothetical protein
MHGHRHSCNKTFRKAFRLCNLQFLSSKTKPLTCLLRARPLPPLSLVKQHQIRFGSAKKAIASILNLNRPSAMRRADNCVHLAPRWGFVIYRTTYMDDAAWKRFMSTWKDMVVAFVSDVFEDGPRLAENFDMIIKEDPAFEGASVETVRTIHQSWAASQAFSYECMDRDIRPDPLKPWLLYEYCIRVDADALASCLNYLNSEGQNKRFPIAGISSGDRKNVPYVTVVRCYDIPRLNPAQNEEEREEDEDEDEDEEFEDSVETEPNSLNLSLDSVYPAFYNDANFDCWSFMEYQLASEHHPNGIVVY